MRSDLTALKGHFTGQRAECLGEHFSNLKVEVAAEKECQLAGQVLLPGRCSHTCEVGSAICPRSTLPLRAATDLDAVTGWAWSLWL